MPLVASRGNAPAVGFGLGGFLAPVDGDFESIATVTVGSGGASNIEFTSIGSNWQHLQVRGVLRTTTASDGMDDIRLRVGNGSIDTGSNYAAHQLEGNGSTTQAVGYGSTTGVPRICYAPRANATASVWGAIVIDILDYASTSKATTVRAFSGTDRNGSGAVMLASGLWTTTSAVTNVRLLPEANNFAQHSTLALYGIKAP